MAVRRRACAHVLLGEQHGDACRGERADELEDLGAITGARPSVGSSSSIRRRLGHQAAADREHLLLAAGQRAGELRLALAQPRKEFVDALDAAASSAGGRAR